MKRLKQSVACCTFFLLAVHVYSTPIAVSQITTNFPAAVATFESGGTEIPTQTLDNPSSYLRLETDGFDIVEATLEEYGIVSATVTGTAAQAEVTESLIRNEAQAISYQRYASAASFSSMNVWYEVENIDAVFFSLDMTLSMELLTVEQSEDAFGVLDQYLALYWLDGNSLSLLTENQFTLDMEVIDGESFIYNKSQTLDIAYNFGTDPFSGTLVIRGIAESLAGTEAPLPTSVPEPALMSLLAFGIGAVTFRKLFRKVNAD